MTDRDACETTVATFDKYAERYAEKYFHLDLYDEYLARYAKRIAVQGCALDAACGPGNVSAYLTKQRPDLKLVGVDLAAGMLAQAKQRVPDAEFFRMDCRRLDELGRVFDAVAFAFGLSYLTDADALRFFAALRACVADKAPLYLSTITGEPRRSGFEASSSGDRVYMEYRRVDDVIAMVEREGFTIDFTAVLPSPVDAAAATQDLVLIAQRVL
jgi:SAM-dependent methyltransferase